MPSINLRNRSPDPQARVCSVMVPTARLDELGLGRHGITDLGWLWQRGREIGDQTVLWLRADLAGGELRSVGLTGWRTAEDLSWALPPVRFDWLLDQPSDAVLRLAINGSEAALAFDRVVETGPLVSLWRFQAKGMGFYAVAYATIPIGQDVFDLQGFVVWSDRRTQSVMLSNARLELRHGEQHAAYLANSLGQGQPIAGRSPHVLLDGAPANWMPDAMGMPFFGALIAEPDVPTVPAADLASGVIAIPTAPAGVADVPMVDKLRMANARAALGGPIYAVASQDVWDGHVGPHRARLTVPFQAAPSGFQDVLRDPWSQRPWANAKQSGQTGDQGIFGRIKALHIFCGSDPIELEALRFASTDYWLRSHHHLDQDSQPLTFEAGLIDPRTTYGTAPFWRVSGGAWGKNGGNNDPPWGWDHGERAYLDWQHRGNLYMPIALMLLGDPILQDELDFLLASDIRDVRFRQPQSIEAPRAVGRCLQEGSWWWYVATPTQREHLQTLAKDLLAIAEQQPSYHVNGPQKWLAVFSRFDDKNPLRNLQDAPLGWDAASPWEHSFVCDGTTAQASIFQRLGDTATMGRFLTMAVTLARSVVEGALIEDPAAGVVVITYLRVNPDGVPNSGAYFMLPRPPVKLPDGTWIGDKTTLEANCDAVIGGISLTWYSGAILTAAKAGGSLPIETVQKAQRIRDVLYRTSHSQRDVEWLVGD